MIPFLDVKAAYTELKGEIDQAIARVLDSGHYILGEEVAAFEAEFAAYAGAAHCVGVGNGLDALTLAFKALDIGPGDEVIVPSNTYIATWLAVSSSGATPVPVEPDPVTHCLDPDRVAASVTARTRALCPVHLYGHPANLPQLKEICARYGLKMVEDAAQAHGARIGERRIGGDGDVVAWSFYPGKNLGALGDGGAVTTNDADVAKRIAMLRNYGSSVKYVNLEKGMNSRLDPLQAAILRVKLPYLDAWNGRRQEIAQRYEAGLAGLPIGLPSSAPGMTHAWHLYVVTSPKRDLLQERLATSGVGTLVHYPIPPFRQQAYGEMAPLAQKWPVADRLAKEALSLPMGPHLSFDDVDRVIVALRAAVAES
ncbi:DegT/DnrJ/EryC1/StrS family aminotransferase [Methylocystis echinoides]|uniref:DegT/DnrJ/EryC1/StrS family aminotransferase n=1 Tax=Methylocystis echinoides TaxID=29468 RepID=UPI00341BB62F